MTQDEIRAIALEVARMDELMGPKDTFAFTKDRLVDFATRFLAAITAKAEPVAWMNMSGKTCSDDWKKHHARENDADSFYKPLYTNPAIEPAPQTSYEAYKEHKRKRLEEAGFLKSPLRGAAPLPGEVAQMVELLRDCSVNEWRKNRRMAEAADLIERLARERDMWRETDLRDAARVDELAEKLGRLARQVPDGCVVVPREPTDAMLVELFRGYTTRELAYKSMIAAGEVKP